MPAALRPPGMQAREAHHLTKDEKKAAAELEELEQQKAIIGPSMDRTGVRMANNKRRKGFLDDEDFEDEIESEGEAPHEYEDDEGDEEDGEQEDEGEQARDDVMEE